MTPARVANELQMTVTAGRWGPTIVVMVDGDDLLAVEHPLSWRGDPLNYQPPDPRRLLPPDSFDLIPTAAPRRAMVGVCLCGEAGCDSLWVQIRRDGTRVIWEPDPRPPRHSIDHCWTFELRAYLDVIDHAAERVGAIESRARRLARQIRGQRDSLFGFPVSNRTAMFECLGAEAMWSDRESAGPQLGLRLAGPDGDWTYLVPLPDERTDAEILEALHVFEPENHERTFGGPWLQPVPGREDRC